MQPRSRTTMAPPATSHIVLVWPHLSFVFLGALISICCHGNGAMLSDLSTSLAHTNSNHHELTALATPTEQVSSVLEQSPDKEKATEGEDVVFSCLLRGNAPRLLEVTWLHQGPQGDETVLQGNSTGLNFLGRAFLSGDLGAGDLSMTLLNVSMEDHGLFLCNMASDNATTTKGTGTRLSVIERQGVEESVGTLVGVAVAAVGVAIGLIAVIVTQFRQKIPCLQK